MPLRQPQVGPTLLCPDSSAHRFTCNAHTMHTLISRQWFTASGALVAQLHSGIQPVDLFEQLSGAKHLLFLESASLDASTNNDAAASLRLGRYSFVAADPIHSIVVQASAHSPDIPSVPSQVAQAFASIRSLLADLACPTIPGLPPFQGGVAGLVSYECGLGRLHAAAPDHLAGGVPLLSLHLYDVVCAFDHDSGRGWIISQGVPARGPVARRARAQERLQSVLACLQPPHPTGHHMPEGKSKEAPAKVPARPQKALHQLATHQAIFSTHSPETYRDMVRAGIELVCAGDIFQVNLSQRLSVALAIDPMEIYRRARTLNPAPFASYFDCGAAQIVSMSPERFLQVSRGTVRMHPIKGTRRVLASPEADLYASDDLGASAKDRAENVMIVDLVRNDLSRVCTPQSVRVEALCRLERYRYVQHLVSIVAGRLRPGLDALDALDAAMPAGSVTGAPKFRACEIITNLEGVARGAYCGSLGYVGLDGSADLNLLIRTFVAAAGQITFSVGGGITAQSDPAEEYAETLHKAEGMLRVLDSFDLPSSLCTADDGAIVDTHEQAAR